MSTLDRPNGLHPAFSIVSILAVIAAVLSFTTGPGVSLLMAIGAIVLGALGMLIAILPGKRGGVVSILSMIAGLLGVFVAIIRIFVHLAHSA